MMGSLESMEDIQIVVHDGNCAPGKCKGETACKNFPNKTYTCVCTHTSLPPTLQGECPRRIVSKNKNVQPKIPVQPPQQDGDGGLLKIDQNVTTMKSPSMLIPQTQASVVNIVVASTICIAGLLSLLLIAYYLRWKTKRRTQATSPVGLKHSLLLPERYAPNPQYSACSGTDVPVIRKETLKFFNELGEGCFGKVYKGELLKDQDQKPTIVAVKVLKDTATKEAQEDFFREVEIMSTFQHPNILSFVGVVLKEGSSTINPMMVFEYMEHGDLAEVLRNQKNLGSESSRSSSENSLVWDMYDLLSISLQIARGMEYLAAQRFVHRDLACRNCLVAQGPVVKIADFGMSRDVYTCDYYKIGGSRMLPVRWMSPESVVYGRFTLESDIWSYGVVLWEIYSFGKQPYYGHSNDEVVKLILDGIMLIPPEDCPSLICELMKKCWKTEPKHRITFPAIREVLEVAHNGKNIDFHSKPTDELKIVNEVKLSSMEVKPKTLPRPPPLPMSKSDLLDSHGYLMPNDIIPVQYLKMVAETTE